MSSPVSDYLSFGTTEYEEAEVKSPLMNRQKMSPKKKEDEDLFEFFNRGIPLLNSTNILDKKPDIPSNKRELK